jgi:hypothetical protein
MNLIARLKAAFPKLFPALAAVAVLGTAGGYAAHSYLRGDCCHPGSSCCYPGSPCCAGHKVAQK